MAASNAVCKQIVVKVFHPKTKLKKCQRIIFKAAKGKGFTEEGVAKCLSNVVFDCAKAYPGVPFKETYIGNNTYNFVPDESPR